MEPVAERNGVQRSDHANSRHLRNPRSDGTQAVCFPRPKAHLCATTVSTHILSFRSRFIHKHTVIRDGEGVPGRLFQTYLIEFVAARSQALASRHASQRCMSGGWCLLVCGIAFFKVCLCTVCDVQTCQQNCLSQREKGHLATSLL